MMMMLDEDEGEGGKEGEGKGGEGEGGEGGEGGEDGVMARRDEQPKVIEAISSRRRYAFEQEMSISILLARMELREAERVALLG